MAASSTGPTACSSPLQHCTTSSGSSRALDRRLQIADSPRGHPNVDCGTHQPFHLVTLSSCHPSTRSPFTRAPVHLVPCHRVTPSPEHPATVAARITLPC